MPAATPAVAPITANGTIASQETLKKPHGSELPPETSDDEDEERQNNPKVKLSAGIRSAQDIKDGVAAANQVAGKKVKQAEKEGAAAIEGNGKLNKKQQKAIDDQKNKQAQANALEMLEKQRLQQAGLGQ